MIVDLSSLIGVAVGVSSSNTRAIEKASEANTAAIADLKREIIRLNGGTIEPERAVFHSEYLYTPPVTPKPATTAEKIGSFVVIAILFAVLYYFVSHP